MSRDFPPLDFEDKFPFGRHYGETVAEIIDDDPQFMLWILGMRGPGFFTPEVEREIRKYEK